MAYKTFTNGSTLSASDLNTYLVNQSIPVFADATARDAAIASPIEGQYAHLTTTDSLTVFDGSSWTGAIPQSINYVINGAFEIWQRGSGVALGADRWDGVSSAVITQSTDTPNGIGFSAVFNRSPSFQAQTKLESVNVEPLAGQVATVSFWAKAGIDASAEIALRYPTAVDDWSASTTFATKAISITTSWQRFTFTTTMDALVSRGLQINLNSSGLSGQDVYLAEVQLEAGSATPFRRHANGIQGELAACQRYYVEYDSNGTNVFGGIGMKYGVAGSNYYLQSILHPVTMRVAPTVSITGTIVYTNSSNLSVSATTAEGSLLRCSVSGTGQYRAYGFGYQADAEL